MRRTTIVKYTKFSEEELKKSFDDPQSCVAAVQLNEILSLRPRDCEHIVKGVRRCVMDKIGRYHPQVNGIVLGYAKIRIENTLSAFRMDSPYLHVRATIDYYVFQPRIGSTLRGTVNYVSKTFVSAMIYKVFNVTVKLDGSTNTYGLVKKGSEISFIIKSCDMKSEIPVIDGELVLTESQKAACSKSASLLKTKSTVSNIKMESMREEEPQLDTAVSIKEEEENPQPKKKKNKKTTPSETGATTTSNGDLSPAARDQNESKMDNSQLIQSLLDAMMNDMNNTSSVSKKKKKGKKEHNGETNGSEEVSLRKVEDDLQTSLNDTPATPAGNGSSKTKKRKIRFDLHDTITYINSEEPVVSKKRKSNKE